MANLKLHTNGSIVEPVIAIVMFVLAMAMAFTILTRTNTTPLIQAKNMAGELVSQELFNTITKSDFIDKEEQYDAFKLQKEVTILSEGKSVLIILTVFDRNQDEILCKKRIVSTALILQNE